ncbi:hybrid sensor histidine kinase/response regulator transcription factor [Bacteroides pyogenes]|uniref:hybrid sensor histidine kinase/response regulator transcription factor n=1 Tax=Bacteroides pyogenes TaxID=310300 RepID=UPI0024316A33|nr:hybrid sensor histidine kinase/response regulator transcription factor [Bacteroides pyogenes]MCI7071049.1 ATP-binding protein [Bacteroides pyogenes]MDY5433748.1 two-component regulator propeller domain-containing protein [Bacteroides pyogenes]
MFSLKDIIFYLLFLCVGANFTFAASDQITFSHISINEGLSQSTVFSIDQDKRGNMWFATYDGVNKYDGYAFTVYRHDESNPNSIPNDISRIVKADSRGRIWIGTRDGLSCYDEEKDQFKNFFYQKKRGHISVNAIAEITPDQLLINTSEGLTLFDVKSSVFTAAPLNRQMRELPVSTLYRSGNHIYIGTFNKGLFCYSVSERTLQKLTPALDDKQIQAVLQQSPTQVWVATEGHGLFLINPKTKKAKNYLHSASDSKSISSNYIRSLALDGQNRLWIGTLNDLNIFQERTDSFISYGSSPTENGSLSQRSVRSIFMDSQGGMWLGTYFGGLNYYHPIRNRFKNIRRIPYKNSLSDNVVSCIVEDKDKNLWIGTNDGGLNLYNTANGQFTHYTLQESERERGMGSNNIKAVYLDEPGGLVYIGTHAGGLNILHRSTGKVGHFDQKNSELINENVYAILPDEEGGLWLGTLGALVRFEPRKQSFTTVEKEKNGTLFTAKRITTLFRDSEKRLWIGGEEGISVYTQHKGELQRESVLPKSSITEAFVNCIYESSNGIFWIGTREGVYCFNEKKKKIIRYTTAKGLPNNVVYGILEDSSGQIWLSTNRGIACFHPETEKFRNFTESDGLQSNQFTSSYCRTSTGQMYFGGIEGITTFRPELLLDNPYAPPVVITRLQLFNKTVRPDDETGILTKNISETKRITLKSSQTAFSLEFVVSNYISGQHNTFAYQLEGYDKEWYYLTDKRTVSYSNLRQGTYHFHVKAANSDGKWNTTPTTLEIIVLPVWYKTWWALLLFLIAFIAFLTFVFRFFWMRKSMAAELEMERRDKEHQEEINQMKMRFFINISHELRTPLTLILAPLQEIINRISDRWTRNQLEYIGRNANRLLHLVNQLMDYRRAELGVFELKVKKGNAHRLISENFRYYDKLARHKNIAYSLHSELEEKEMLFDPNYLELILNNLLSNAFKYTGNGQSITVTLEEDNGWLLLQVSDTGIGIPINKQGKIFERFYQVESEYVGSGIGLSLVQRLVELHHGRIELESEEGKGSCFSVRLPQSIAVYAVSELADEENPEEEQVYSTNSKEMYFIDTETETTEAVESRDKKRGTILIVEDNQEIRHYLTSGLAELFNTLEAENGEKALEILKENEADVIVTDVMMPVMDGIKLCKNVKQNIRTCHIPVIILSAKTDIKHQMEGLQVGADDYIPKPFSLSVLTTKIQNMMRTRHRMIERYSKSLEVEPEKITFNAMDEALLKRAVSIVEKNMDNASFSTDEFAREMNMSRSNLHLKMKAITGESTIDFIRKIRFNEATKLLKDGRYTVAEVSTMVGFNTPSYFATSFKKYFGYLPTEYIRKLREGN